MAEDNKKSTADEMFEFTSALQMATASLRDAIEGTTKNTEEVEKNTATAKAERERKRKEAEDDAKRKKTKDEYDTAVKKTKDSFKKLGNEINQIINAGVKLGGTLGVSATKGVEVELKNRLASIVSLANFNANLIQSAEQIQSAQEGFTAAFIGAREGFQVSSRGAGEFVKSLKEGFKSEFTPTAETFKILTQMGMSTTSQFDAFRRATGRASLSNNQLATLYNKNQLSFLLYGNSFAKAAVQAERLGVNLASIQSAQESLVTNLDGTIDTVAQINQLGGSIDFSELVRISEQEGPAALLSYVRATVPANMMQSASTRALFKQLGISVEDYIKSGDAQQSAANQLERQMTDAATETNGFVSAITYATRAINVLMTTFGGLIFATFGTIASLKLLGAAGIRSALTSAISGLSGFASALLPITGVLLGIAGLFYGRKLVREGETGKGLLAGAASGALAGGIIGSYFGGIGAVPGALIGAGIGLVTAGTATPMRTGGDVVSTPSGKTTIGNIGSIGSSLADAGELGYGAYLASSQRARLSSLLSKGNGLGAGNILSGLFEGMGTYSSSKAKGRSTTEALGRGGLMALMSGGLGLGAGLFAASLATGGTLPILLGLAGSLYGSKLGQSMFNKYIGDDVMSMPSGYGNRILLTPEGPIALNNKDTVMAFADDMVSSTTKLPLGYLATLMGGAQTNNTTLINKVNQLIDVIGGATTTVSIDNKIQQVPRMAMAGVYTRNERV